MDHQPLKQTAHITNVVGKAGNNHMRIVDRSHVAVQRATAENIVSRKRYKQRMLDVVVESVAISNAFERDTSRRRHDLNERRLRRSEPTTHIGTDKLFQDICCQLR